MFFPENYQEFEKSQLFEFEENHLCYLRKLCIVGDLHGDYTSVCSLLRLIDPLKDGIVFLGDYADRGDRGIEVIELIKRLIKKHDQNVIALKGNHEAYTESGVPTFFPCDLIEEARTKKGSWKDYFLTDFQPFLKNLYIAAIIPNEMLFVHGGISSKIKSLEDLKYPTEETEKDILWSDPFDGIGERSNRRGVGVEFGMDVSKKICDLLGVKRIVRSHEPTKVFKESRYSHEGRVITTSSTRVYGNNPFFLSINPTDFSMTSFNLF